MVGLSLMQSKKLSKISYLILDIMQSHQGDRRCLPTFNFLDFFEEMCFIRNKSYGLSFPTQEWLIYMEQRYNINIHYSSIQSLSVEYALINGQFQGYIGMAHFVSLYQIIGQLGFAILVAELTAHIELIVILKVHIDCN